MGFLRRIFRGGAGSDDQAATAVDDDDVGPVEVKPDADERQHELEVLRSEAERLDELTRRQLRYADYAWQPPDQGGDRRADDRD